MQGALPDRVKIEILSYNATTFASMDGRYVTSSRCSFSEVLGATFTEFSGRSSPILDAETAVKPGEQMVEVTQLRFGAVHCTPLATAGFTGAVDAGTPFLDVDLQQLALGRKLAPTNVDGNDDTEVICALFGLIVKNVGGSH